LEKLDQKREKIQEEIKNKFLNIKRNYINKDEKKEESKSKKRK